MVLWMIVKLYLIKAFAKRKIRNIMYIDGPPPMYISYASLEQTKWDGQQATLQQDQNKLSNHDCHSMTL